MANIPHKILLFCVGLLAAGFGTAYFAGAFNPAGDMTSETVVSDAPESSVADEPQEPSRSDRIAAAKPTDLESANMTGEPTESSGGIGADADGTAEGAAVIPGGGGSAEAGESSSVAESADDVVVPAFDVLRVEPDGSMVVAGKAAPNAEVQVLSGSSVLATTAAGSSGDFAAVLDKPLEPGEHNIVLRGTSPDNAATSVETAIVSIPSSEDGEVVALVQQPGEPSRLITVPQPELPASIANTGAQTGTPDEAEGMSGVVPGGTVGEEQRAQNDQNDTPGPVDSADTRGDGSTAGEDGGEIARTDTEGPSDAPTDSRTSGQEVARETPGASQSQGQEAPQNKGSGEVSAFIEAVEIDGREVFVAGRAEPERRVRVYVNDILLGQTDVSPDGTFLVEAERDLPAGDYIVRVDVLDDDGATVIARAAVPFERPDGEKFAAVAGDAGMSQTPHPGQREGSTGPGVNGARSDAASEGNEQKAQRAARIGASKNTGAGEASEQGGGVVSGDTETRVLPPLEQTDGSVIIRRGDTLWHISRRIYGHGVRYSTIYLANQDQIRDPNLIYPGQIFAIPDATGEGETADLNAIGEQALSPDDADAPDSDS